MTVRIMFGIMTRRARRGRARQRSGVFILFGPSLLLYISDKEIYLYVTYPYKEV